MYASNASRSCVYYCPKTPSMSYADVYVTRRCVLNCSDTYYADDFSGNGICVSSCAGTYRFRDNSTKSCVSICSLISLTFGDTIADICVYQCPLGYYAQQDNQQLYNEWVSKYNKN